MALLRTSYSTKVNKEKAVVLVRKNSFAVWSILVCEKPENRLSEGVVQLALVQLTQTFQ
jgi:hypothetical protein